MFIIDDEFYYIYINIIFMNMFTYKLILVAELNLYWKSQSIAKGKIPECVCVAQLSSQ